MQDGRGDRRALLAGDLRAERGLRPWVRRQPRRHTGPLQVSRASSEREPKSTINIMLGFYSRSGTVEDMRSYLQYIPFNTPLLFPSMFR